MGVLKRKFKEFQAKQKAASEERKRIGILSTTAAKEERQRQEIKTARFRETERGAAARRGITARARAPSPFAQLISQPRPAPKRRAAPRKTTKKKKRKTTRRAPQRRPSRVPSLSDIGGGLF